MSQKKSKYTVRADGRIMMTRTIGGKRVSFYGASDREVEQKYADYLQTPPEICKPKVRTFAQCAEDWWEEKEPELSPNSVRNYKALYGFARDYFNATPVNEITPAEIVTYLRRLSAQGFSQKAITNRKSVIKSILDNALIHGEIIFNPCINLPVVKGKAKVPRRVAEADDIAKIEAHRNDSDIARLFYFILWTGCRKGEAAALQEKHIDRKAKTAHICQTLVYSSPTPQIKDCPKTEAGVRDVILPQNVIDNLPKYNSPDSYIFFPHGLPKEKALQKMIDGYRESIGLACTLHQLRHSYATMLHTAGVDAKDAQNLLGHSSILVTQDIYTEVDKYAKENARMKIEEFAKNRGVLSKVLSKSEESHESST